MQHTVNNLSSAVTKLEQEVIHHEPLLREQSKSLSTHDQSILELSSRIDKIIAEKDKEVSDLNQSLISIKNELTDIKKDVTSNKFYIDENDQYERRDSLIFSGPCIPKEKRGENVAEIIVHLVRSDLFLPLSLCDISVCHRLGPKSDGKERPIICKFLSRSVKDDIKYACVTFKPKPGLYANESLTPLRRDIFHKLRKVKKEHPTLIEDLQTNDGKIMMKVLTNERRDLITNPANLNTFLQKHPAFKETYESVSQLHLEV